MRMRWLAFRYRHNLLHSLWHNTASSLAVWSSDGSTSAKIRAKFTCAGNVGREDVTVWFLGLLWRCRWPRSSTKNSIKAIRSRFWIASALFRIYWSGGTGPYDSKKIIGQSIHHVEESAKVKKHQHYRAVSSFESNGSHSQKNKVHLTCSCGWAKNTLICKKESPPHRLLEIKQKIRELWYECWFFFSAQYVQLIASPLPTQHFAPVCRRKQWFRDLFKPCSLYTDVSDIKMDEK